MNLKSQQEHLSKLWWDRDKLLQFLGSSFDSTYLRKLVSGQLTRIGYYYNPETLEWPEYLAYL